jgi:hypothetical protein
VATKRASSGHEVVVCEMLVAVPFVFLWVMSLLTIAVGCGRLGFEQSRDAGVGTDSVADATAGNSNFCATQTAAFGEDFDGAEPVWSFKETTGQGSIATDTLSSISKPNARRVMMAAGLPTAPCQYVSERQAINAPAASAVRIEYQLRLGRLTTGGGLPQSNPIYISGFSVSAADGSGGCDLYSSIDSTLGVQLTVYPQDPSGTQASFSLARVLMPKKWTHVAFEVTHVNDIGRVSAWLDGISVLTDAVVPTSPKCKFGLLQRVGNGLYCYSGDSEIEFRVDNLAATVR